MDSDDQAELVRVLGEVSSAGVPMVGDGSGAVADAMCRGCGGMFAWGEMGFDEEACEFECAGCRQKARLVSPLQKVLAVARLPLFWVAGVTVLAGLFYVSGIGRMSLAEMEALDRQKNDWKAWRVPVKHLKQVARTQTVVGLMAEEKRRPKDLAAWARVCGQASMRAAEAWEGEPPEPHLRLVSAQMMGHVGKAEEGYKAALALAGDFPKDDKSYATYLFIRGSLALEAGRKAAGQQDLEAVLELTRGESMALFDMTAIDQLIESGGRMTMGISEDTVRDFAGTDQEDGWLARESIMQLKRHRVNSLLGKSVEREIKQSGGWNRKGEGLVVEGAD